MLNFYFTITFYVDGRMMLEHSSFTVTEFMSVKAWRKAMDYAIARYGSYLRTVELHSISSI